MNNPSTRTQLISVFGIHSLSAFLIYQLLSNDSNQMRLSEFLAGLCFSFAVSMNLEIVLPKTELKRRLIRIVLSCISFTVIKFLFYDFVLATLTLDFIIYLFLWPFLILGMFFIIQKYLYQLPKDAALAAGAGAVLVTAIAFIVLLGFGTNSVVLISVLAFLGGVIYSTIIANDLKDLANNVKSRN